MSNLKEVYKTRYRENYEKWLQSPRTEEYFYLLNRDGLTYKEAERIKEEVFQRLYKK